MSGGQECIHDPNLLFKLGKKSCYMMISNCKFTNNKELISKLGHLRVFSLSGYGISETPNSFYGFKHLIQEMIIYYNLQMLILSSYKHLTKIPINFGNPINVWYLDIIVTSLLEEMSLEIDKLKDL